MADSAGQKLAYVYYEEEPGFTLPQGVRSLVPFSHLFQGLCMRRVET